VLIAGRFPAEGDPLVAAALDTPGDVRVEAAARPERLDAGAARRLRVTYREDDGFAERALALAALAGRHPLRCLRYRRGLWEIAAAVRRIARERPDEVRPLGSGPTVVLASRIARLIDRRA
jgi:hypothetical protein